MGPNVDLGSLTLGKTTRYNLTSTEQQDTPLYGGSEHLNLFENQVIPSNFLYQEIAM